MWKRVLLVTGGFGIPPSTQGTDQTCCSKHKADSKIERNDKVVSATSLCAQFKRIQVKNPA